MADETVRNEFKHLNLQDLVNVINTLSQKVKTEPYKKGQIQILKIGNGIGYKTISKDEMSILGTLQEDEKIVFQYVKASENRGIWIKDLKMKSNLHQNVLSKILKNLESKKIVKAVKSVKVSSSGNE